MNRRLYKILIALMWIVLPLTALRYWQVWDRLPASMATHFAPDGHANGWMTREGALYYALGVSGFLLVIFTVVSLVVLLQKTAPETSSFALLGFFHVILGFMFYVNNSILRHNLTGSPVSTSPVLLGVPIALVLFLWVFLRAQRGTALPEGPTLAEETHGSWPFAVLFLILAGVELAIFAVLPQTGVRLGMAALCLVFLLVAAHAGSGFHYRVTPAGIEISTLGFRLRSISRDKIGRYTIEKWNALRGYGIRGMGNCRAYVWGNQVVHITTLEGEVFLGTSDPARLVRDLDAMKQYAHS